MYPDNSRKLQLSSRANKIRRQSSVVLMAMALGTSASVIASPGEKLTTAQAPRLRPLQEKLDTHIPRFDNTGRPLVESILELAYEYHLPMGLEYVNRDAVRRPLDLKLRDSSVRDIIASLVTQVPGYQVSFSNGIVQIYSPKARADPSNLLNAVIDNFEVKDRDAQATSVDVFTALAVKLNPRTNVVSSTAVGSLGSSKLTLQLQKKKVREILDTIVATNGAAIWVVRVPPERLSKFEGTFWYIYSLDPFYKAVILHDLQSLFPPEKDNRSTN